MWDVSDIFSSRARYLTLQTLALRAMPCHLRLLSALTGLHIRSIELTLQELRRQRLVVFKKRMNRLDIELNPKHAQVDFLRKLFRFIQLEKIQSESALLNDRAKSTVRFIESAANLIEQAKRK